MWKIMRLVGTPLAASAAMATFLLAPATTAHAAQSIDFADSATLVARGAAVLVPVDVTCDGTSSMGTSVMVALKERTGNRVVDGSGSTTMTCDGSAHTVGVLVRAEDAPFKPGTALATASTFACDFTGCQSVAQTAEIRIRN